MTDQSTFSRLRGAFKNAIVWGMAWGAMGFAVSSVVRLTDNVPVLNAIGDGLGMGIRIGAVGAVSGAVFSAFIGLAYRGKRLSDISPARFGIVGAILAGLFVPVYLQSMNLLSGDGPVAWNLISGDFVMAALFGGITAAGTLKLAQRGEATDPDSLLEHLDAADSERLGAGDAATFAAEQRACAAERS